MIRTTPATTQSAIPAISTLLSHSFQSTLRQSKPSGSSLSGLSMRYSLVEQPRDLRERPDVIGYPGRHRRGSRIGILQALVRASEIVKLEVKRHGRRVV